MPEFREEDCTIEFRPLRFARVELSIRDGRGEVLTVLLDMQDGRQLLHSLFACLEQAQRAHEEERR